MVIYLLFLQRNVPMMTDTMPKMYQDWVPLCRFPGSSAICAAPLSEQSIPNIHQDSSINDQATAANNPVSSLSASDQNAATSGVQAQKGMWVLTMVVFIEYIFYQA